MNTKFSVVITIPTMVAEVESAAPVFAAQTALDCFAQDRRASLAPLHLLTVISADGYRNCYQTFNTGAGQLHISSWAPDENEVTEQAFTDEAFAHANIRKLLECLRRVLSENAVLRRRGGST